MPPVDDENDLSNGWEAKANVFRTNRNSTIGAATVQEWAKHFKPGQEILDVGCGFGGSYTSILLENGIKIHGVDASPTLVNEYRMRFPSVLAECEAAEMSSFFGKTFEGILSVGLIFLLSEESQIAVLNRMAAALKQGGSLLFSAPYQVCDWDDLTTGKKSISLGREKYVCVMQARGLSLENEYTDEGGNHYYQFHKHG